MHDSVELDPDRAFMHRILTVLRRRHELRFEECVREYRQIEAEFVERAGDDAVLVADRKRSITNHLLIHAESTEQPHEVCREIWNELLQRGFWDITMRHTMSSTYARCCQSNGEFDAGIAVLETRITELKQWLHEPTVTPNNIAFCEQFITMHETSVDELKAGIRERLMPHTGQWKPEEIALTQRVNAVQFRERKNGLSFEEAMNEYRQIEAEFVERAGDDEVQVVETKRRITEVLLGSAYETEQPHEVCRKIWEELVQRGFSNLERRHSMTDTYVECCQCNGEPDAGLAVVEPLLAELQQQIDTGPDADTLQEYQDALARLERLRDELQAQPQ